MRLRQISFHLFHVACAGGGRRISAVHKAVDVQPFDAIFLREPHQALDVLDVGVYAAVGHEAEQMQGAAVRLYVGYRFRESFVFKKCSVFYLVADHGQVLPHDAAGPHVGVSDFGIAHLSVGQADGSSGGLQLRAGHFRKQAVQVRGAGSCDGVAGPVRGQAEAVHDAEHNRFVHRVKILHMPRLYHKSPFS